MDYGFSSLRLGRLFVSITTIHYQIFRSKRYTRYTNKSPHLATDCAEPITAKREALSLENQPSAQTAKWMPVARPVADASTFS